MFGATRNPYDLRMTPGGSSGGAAAAVASGMLPFADGSDLAASLRNPGSYCNVVGFRPTPGRVPAWPAVNAWNTLSTLGPVARTVSDCAFLFAAMAGPDPRAPTPIDEPGETFLRDLDFGCNDNVLAVGGRLLELRTPGATYTDLYLPLHGAHQGDNAAAALTAVETFFGGPLAPELVTVGLENVVMPGRFEIVGRHPLVVLDGAHNPAGADVAASVIDEEFSEILSKAESANQADVIPIDKARTKSA